MNQKNFEYLKEQVKFAGFGESLHQQLQENMHKQLPEFALQHQARFGGDQISSWLHFKKSASSELYFFNSYLASLKNQDQTQKINHLFSTNHPGSFTLKEAFNLLQGRAVEKQLVNGDGKRYRAWLQMDFKQTELNGNFKIRQFHTSYGYDLEKSLAKLSLRELAEPDSKSRLLDSLRKGNRQQVTLIDGPKQHKLFVEASPQFKAIIVYDQNAVRQQIQQVTQKQSQQISNQTTVMHAQQSVLNTDKDRQQGLSIG
ncbi:hypothetical protein [Dyadobacter pollutisoli]|uniref:DUF3945 domain-containing protein n=1 Tax=Dyadobacter pollutisoli TaxID=2910158 RepID=A0A9E8NAW4_9BACT|nr:hypothetical protein [Dyadobacter pollutisoli]WAC13249.1 hypothetical protein ON006_04650 [Dyadobacter pollutisoli]